MAARSRNTPFAVLGMLSLAPMSGYDIRKESEASVGHFWSESYGQIYPALRDLERQGLIRPRGCAPSPRERRVYEITERGRDALARWRAEPPRRATVRNELLLKLFFGRAGDAPRDIGWIDALLAEERASLRAFTAIRKQVMQEQRDHPSLPFWLVTLSYGEHRSRAVIRWCRETRRALETVRARRPRKAPTP